MKPPTSQCKTCPFRQDSLLKLSDEKMVEIYSYLLAGTNHICHSDHLYERVCWGGRQWQLDIFYRLGFVKAPTNEAIAEAMLSFGIEPRSHV